MHRQSLAALGIAALLTIVQMSSSALGQELPKSDQVKTVELFRVPKYCEGVCFDHDGNGYISWGKAITRFTLDGKHSVWAETGAPGMPKLELNDYFSKKIAPSTTALLACCPEH